MYNLKSTKGVTMVALVITIILLFILGAVSINSGAINLKSTKDSKLKSELEMVGHAVLEQYTKYKTTKDASYLVGNIVPDSEVQNIASQIGITLVNIPDTYSNKDYYKLNNQMLSAIGITNSNDEYIVNYLTGEVINITEKYTSDNKPLYTKANSLITQ